MALGEIAAATSTDVAVMTGDPHACSAYAYAAITHRRDATLSVSTIPPAAVTFGWHPIYDVAIREPAWRKASNDSPAATETGDWARSFR